MVEKVVDATQKAMASAPWGNSIIVDPRGAYSTAAGAVAKTLGLALEKGFGTLGRQKRHRPRRHRTSRTNSRKNLRLRKSQRNHHLTRTGKGQAVADKINKEVGAERVKVVEVTKPEQTAVAIKDAEIILSAGAGGIQLLSAADLNKAKKCKIVADINAIKPSASKA